MRAGQGSGSRCTDGFFLTAAGIANGVALEVIPDGIADNDVATTTIHAVAWADVDAVVFVFHVAASRFEAADDAPAFAETLKSGFCGDPIDESLQVAIGQ